jgi:hypothetical protein
MLALAHHAIERFSDRFARALSWQEAEDALRRVTLAAAPTKRRTVKNDAQLYLSEYDGEPIVLVVRDKTVITVLPAEDNELSDPMLMHVDQEMIDESEATRAACLAMVKNDTPRRFLPPNDLTPDEQRRISARQVVADWKNGAHITDRALRRAHAVLGLPYPPRLAPLRPGR